jgi:hypothetical protein
MSENSSEKQVSEEVDLGQLFKLIGNGFKNFFNFIGSILKGIYNLLLLIMLHFHKRILWYAIAIVIGLVAGYFLDKDKEPTYSAQMFIETNYRSSRQVYEVITDLNQLAEVDKDSIELSKRLGLTINEASNLKGFYIEPDIDKNNLMKQFVDYKNELDSISRLEATFKDFEDGLPKYSFVIHKINAISTDKIIFKKLKETLLAEINSNKYLTAIKKVTLDNLEKRKEEIDNEVEVLNALKEEYLKIRIIESKKEASIGSGTNLYLGNAEKNELIKDETSLVKRIYELENEKQALDVSKVQNQNIVNIISDFPTSGYITEEWYNKMKFILPIASFGITILIFMFLGLDKFLKQESLN